MHLLKQVFTVVFLIFTITFAAQAQMVLGQYEDEAPARTWNTFGLDTAAPCGFGGIPLVFQMDAASPIVNPALLTAGPRLSLSTNASLNKASFFRYGVVNTGVMATPDRVSSIVYALDFVGATLRSGRWGFGASLALLENYDRPRTKGDDSFYGTTTYAIDFKQTGALWNINLSAAYEISPAFSIGVGVNRVFGSYEKSLREDLFYNGNIITDEKNLKYRGFNLTAGLTFHPEGNFSFALSFRSPYWKRASGDSLYRFQNSGTSTDIKIESTAESRFFQPAIVALGAGYTLDQHWRFSLNLSYFGWSRYSTVYFGEDRPRDFRDILKVYGGLEYRRKIKLFGRRIDTPFRIGFCFDPQPVKDPKYDYLYLALSSGFLLGKLHIEISLMLGGERSSGERLAGQRISLSLGYFTD
jgi:hypothetical protein